MEEYGVAVQKFEVCETVRDAEGAAQRLAPGADELVVKAQILAGGRGKGVFDTGYKGGVKVTTDPSDVGMFAGAMLGNRLVTKQTKKGGEQVTKVIVTQGFGPPRETYFAILMDREYSGPTVVASAAGGMDIEQVAASTPEKIVTVPIDIKVGLTRDCARDLALKLEFKQPDEAAEQMQKLYEMFIDVDAVQVEINPLGETKDGRVLCYDAKVNFDDNAKFRQQKIFEMEDESELDPREVIAAQHHLNYIGMDGNIGCLVNGAGLAMATMDIIQANGGMPANFLDVGGGVNERQVIEAFGILTSDEQVKSIFVNIFGGIVNCVTIAQGVTKACQEVEVKVPLVVRLQGNNVDAAKEVMRNSGLNIMSEDDMDEAAKKAVQSARL
ncbi:succinate--CoA ligase [GDP-forming] subunit beta, mitochondrial-like [Corticium candelabrum]|uniref:succinate--CoA ligase [GDP-forming] subunit beta, mitochondrial-like n=1 Tax=Corticium candelabrum TaxID=121492 RepID=UPI002E253CF1|nr:succinate--CoA ligase [GDP-forming] subunit beta, mitochondrial-like [Corticium candelabrum]